ncbi:hypothetical protein EDD18DRAFT_1356148 [Armillaria luteobubalina]|uniref:Peptidase S33 tripeptidyl aminopeptidase-like C-terminal domain-containing protein n=1 Tax=Armillaria luteobubalina TaxID=153913 RepID=A0AA39UL06_9AGAR|nr:hypothetical protein EDD18DRAFT_1356148 [Armillaria luteobubalina]
MNYVFQHAHGPADVETHTNDFLSFTFSGFFLTSILFQTVWAHTDFDWSTIEPTSNLSWVNCYSNYQFSAQLKVPIDYSDEGGDKTALAVIKLSVQSETKYKGVVMMNLGGPGVSGVTTLVSEGPVLVSIIGNQYDIISFDPCGVSNSTPRVEFFSSKEEHSLWLASSNHFTWAVNDPSDQIPELWASAQVYWGFFYGMVLGPTFTAMFPDKIERMILDGVAEMDGYYSIIDTEKDLLSFFDSCVAPGPDTCAFYTLTSKAISNQLNAICQSLLTKPVPVISSSFYGVIDSTVLQMTIRSTLYAPYISFSVLAEGLASLVAGNSSIIYTMQAMYDPPSVYNDSWEVDVAISCSNALSITESLEDLLVYWDRNMADPITPLFMAHKTSSTFPGSIVLAQNSSGHTSLVASSVCMHGYMQVYFQNGTLPDDGVVCDVETELFPGL